MEMENPESRCGASVAVWNLGWSPHRDEDLEWTAGNAAQILFVLQVLVASMFNLCMFEPPLSQVLVCLGCICNPHPYGLERILAL
jgi:hypothetical protein